MRTRLPRVAIAMIGACTVFSAAEAQVPAIAGAGSRTCAQMDVDISDLPNVRRAYVSWMQGYLSGRNAAREVAGQSLVDLADFEAQWEWIVEWCGSRPQSAFAEGVDALFAKLAE